MAAQSCAADHWKNAMSVRFKHEYLSKDQEKLLEKHLTLTPRKTSKNPNIPAPVPIRCYRVDGEYIHVPFLYFSKFKEKYEFSGPADDTINDSTCESDDVCNKSFRFTGVLREHQAPIVAEATEHLDTHKTATLWVYPGAGKTAMGMCLASTFTVNRPVLICICKTALIDSWRGTVASFTDIAAHECYTVPVGAVNPQKLAQAKAVICMDLRLKKLPPHFRAGVCIIDEAHMWCKVPNRVQNVLAIMCEYVILETATFQLENGMDRFLTLVAGHHHVRRDYPGRLTIVKVNTRVNPKIDSDNAIHEFRTKLLEHPDYNGYVLQQVRRFSEHKILILTWLRDHVASMAAYLAQHGIASTQFYGDMTAYKDENVVVGTLGKIGVGFDEVFLASEFNGRRVSVVILPLSVSDTAFFEQCLGRGFRCDHPTIVLFIDSHFISTNHWRKNMKWIDTHDVKLIEMAAAAQ